MLLSRDKFREAVFKRDKNKCVICGRSDLKLDAHHIMDRKLWIDGGYYLDNGASLCDNGYEGCHYKAEKNELLPKDIRLVAGITKVILPAGLNKDEEYDKWGNLAKTLLKKK